MRLIIKDYLLQLKEKDELDFLICDLLLQMGYVTDNLPKTGTRQFGVDIRAHNKKEIFLFVVKQGDLTRQNWDSGQNAVRQSLNEIQDTYMKNITGDDRNKKLHIVVVTNGMIDDTVRPLWEGYKEKNTIFDGMPVQLDFWGIDDLTELVQKNLFDEHIFDAEKQALLRRALYFIGEGYYRKNYYEEIIDLYFSQLRDDDSEKAKKKKISGVLLASQMIATYAGELGYFKIGIMVSEYLIIKYWKYLISKEKFEKVIYAEWLFKFIHSYEKWNEKYYESIKYFCEAKDRLPATNSVEQRVILYDSLGYLVSYAYYLSFINIYDKRCQEVLVSIVQLINNYPQFLYPLYDKHIGVVTMLCRYLDHMGRDKDSGTIIRNLCTYVQKYYQMYKKYPSPIDSFEDAVNIHMGFSADEYVTSAFWGTMLEWIVLMNQRELYDSLFKFLSEDLKDITKCTWFIKSEEEIALYDYYAMNKAGEGASFKIDKEFDKMKESVGFLMQQYEKETFSFETYSFEALEFILCRYYDYLPRVKREEI